MVEGLDACSEWNIGPSREWRPEGTPTTDEELIAILLTKCIPVVEVNALLSRLQKTITEAMHRVDGNALFD